MAAAPVYEMSSYNAPSQLSAELSMRGVTGNEYAHLPYFTPSHVDDHQPQFFINSINDPSSLGSFGMAETDENSPRMHINPDPSPMPSQSFIGAFEEQQTRQVVLDNSFDKRPFKRSTLADPDSNRIQSVIEPVHPRPNHHLDIALPEISSPRGHARRSLRLNPTLSREEGIPGSITPLVVAPYYVVDAPSSPTACRVHPSYGQHGGSTAHDSDDYLHGPANVESPSSIPHSNMEFPTSGISASDLQRAASAGVHYNPAQPFRRLDQQFWPAPRPIITRWSRTEPSSPAEDTDPTLHRDKLRRSSLKTCELEEAGLDFPGCFVLVPTTEGTTGSGQTVIEGPEPGLISTKKNFRRPMGESERQAIKLNRRYGVCLRCKMFKERVYDPIFRDFQHVLTGFSAEEVSLAIAANL